MRQYDGHIYELQKFSEADQEWKDANADFYFVCTDTYRKCHDGWQRYGIYCWEDVNDAFKSLCELQNKYNNEHFRMIKVKVSRIIKGFLYPVIETKQ